MADAALRGFSPATRAWFAGAFAAPTPAQSGAWPPVLAGRSVLVAAPTGSGKTLAAFLAAVDRMLTTPSQTTGVRVLYVSPLKSLAHDVDRNLRAPLTGIGHAAERLGETSGQVRVGMRTGDTPAEQRRQMARTPPDILITTPESLFLLLTSRARETLAGVETVIVDEVHAVAGTKRGAHLALSLERLDVLCDATGNPSPQRVGLSATARPLEDMARFLCGDRAVEIVDATSPPAIDLEIVVPIEDMSSLGEIADDQMRRSIWPAVHPKILELVQAHRSTIVFANSRRLAERLCARLNELADESIARAHHGSVSREQRIGIEEDLKAGRLRCVVATSSLELGIDMGAVDLVIQVESPGSAARGLQRIGRAGHQFGQPSTGKLFPKYRGDLVEAAVVARRMRAGQIEATALPRNPLDVLAQQIVAMAAMDTWKVDDLHAVLRRAASFAELSRTQLDGVLDMLSGRYPADAFAELRPRINWDRVADEITGRPGAQRLAVTSGGTIPDRGLYGVFTVGEGPGRRVGELDEEMVYETRPGEVITLGASSWRIEEITRDQVLVSPAPGEPGKLPFWHGDAPGRPLEVGRAVGAFLREAAAGKPDQAVARLQAEGLDPLAARNLVAYVGEQHEVTGAVPTDRQIVVERFRDEIGDWRVCILSPFGGRVHAPWALAIEQRLRERLGLDVHTMYADDGIVIRLPDTDELPPLDEVLIDPDDVEDLVVGSLAGSALFASRFRECAARALLLPRRRPGSRTPLWQQRQRAADLLAAASRYGGFPVTLETYRECLQDVFDLPALTEVLGGIASRRIRVAQVETESASPFASSLLFGYIATYMYEGDLPLAERRAQALSLDRELLAELLGSGELRDLIDAAALDDLELELQRLVPERHARSVDAVGDLLREIGDLRSDEVAARTDGPAETWLGELEQARRAIRVRVAGEERWVAAEDAARLRDGLGVPPPPGVPDAFLAPVEEPLVDLVSRYARTHGPFTVAQVGARLGLPADAVRMALERLARDGRVSAGEFRPGGVETEWCDADVLRRVRRRSLAVLRREVEPVDPAALARFLPGWQGVGSTYGNVTRTLEVVEQLQGAPLPASVLETSVLPARVRDYRGAWLDELAAAGEIVWVGRGALGLSDGRVALYLRGQAPLLAPVPGKPADHDWWTDRHAGILSHLEERGASFWPQVYGAAGGGDEQAALEALWDLVWAGYVTNDTLAPLRALTSSGPRRTGRRRPGRAIVRSGPPTASGRWSLVAELVDPVPSATLRAAALGAQLLDRHGVLVRGALGPEDVAGGFSAVYPVLQAMEEGGRARRGYFVEHLGGAQFAVPGAVDRLRSTRPDDEPATLVLAATDPANPYGAALAWPETAGESGHAPRRAAGALVVLADGEPTVYLERGGRSALTFTGDGERLDAAAAALARSVERRLVVGRIDGEEPGAQPLAAALRAHGFTDHPRGLVKRA
jgi:ATP-dependent helicase Lhr and Lhr-like helicase